MFIDGSWLYANLPELARSYGKPDFQIDFGKMPRVIAADIAEQAGVGTLDLVRVHYFSSYAENYDIRDHAAVQRRLTFYARLREEHGYEVETFPINYQGRRLRRQDRDPADDFAPKEKCVDIALAVSVMRYASLPGAMDIALMVLGDRDFVPLLQEVRRLGRRVGIASIDGSCSDDLCEPLNAAAVRDYDVVWLSDLSNRIEKWRARPRVARAEPGAGRQPHDAVVGEILAGAVKNIIWDRGYGFIAAEDGRDYFFHANALEESLLFDDLQPDMEVVFQVKSGPSPTRAGAAGAVFRAGSEALSAFKSERDAMLASAPHERHGDDDDGYADVYHEAAEDPGDFEFDFDDDVDDDGYDEPELDEPADYGDEDEDEDEDEDDDGNGNHSQHGHSHERGVS